MIVSTKNFGSIEYDPNDIIYFREGIPGFETLHNFLILTDNSQNIPFKWLQSLDETDIAFAIIEPESFKPDYTVEITDEIIKVLDIEDLNHLLIFVIVVIPEEIEKITANLKAPIIINAENNKAVQVILENEKYLIKHPILEELKNAYSNS